MTLQSVLGCKVCSALKKQSVPRSKVFFDAKCASAVQSKGALLFHVNRAAVSYTHLTLPTKVSV